MRVHIISIDLVINGPFIPRTTDDVGVVLPKLKAQWTTEEDKKQSYDWEVKKFLIYSLGVD